jgi:hypothetical protein
VLVLDDHENLCGGPMAAPEVAAAAWAALRDVCRIRQDTAVVVGMSPFAAANFMLALPLKQVRFVVGSGPDGADKALLATCDAAQIAARYDTVVIASGDHIFADLAADLRERGVAVWNVTSDLARPSPRLRRACGRHMVLRLRTVVGSGGAGTGLGPAARRTRHLDRELAA